MIDLVSLRNPGGTNEYHINWLTNMFNTCSFCSVFCWKTCRQCLRNVRRKAGADAREALEDCEKRKVELDVMPAALLTVPCYGSLVGPRFLLLVVPGWSLNPKPANTRVFWQKLKLEGGSLNFGNAFLVKSSNCRLLRESDLISQSDLS